MPFLFFDTRYMMFMLPAFIIMLLVQWYVNSTYKKWGKIPTRSRLTGAQAAQKLVYSGNLYDVEITGVTGKLTDYYDPRTRQLHLSPEVYQSPSVASVAVAAHELGHAMQDQEGYMPLRFRAALVPAVNIGSTLGWILILLGLVLRFTELAWVGVLVFSGGAVFALATLPVELNASARAKQLLAQSGIINGEDEQRGVNAVLNAAALTYVAALITAVMQVLYWSSLVMGMGGRRRR